MTDTMVWGKSLGLPIQIVKIVLLARRSKLQLNFPMHVNKLSGFFWLVIELNSNSQLMLPRIYAG